MNKHCYLCRHAAQYDEDGGLTTYSCHIDLLKPRATTAVDGCEKWEIDIHRALMLQEMGRGGSDG